MATRRLLLSFAPPSFIASGGCVNAIERKLRHIRHAGLLPGLADRPSSVRWLVPAPERIYDVRTMTEDAPPTSPQTPPLASEAGPFLQSLMDTELYSIGAFFCDEHPDLVEEVVARSEDIERRGLEAYSRDSGGPIEEAFETLLTGLAVRYYKAVAG
jgi:hypothetical protein